MLLASSISESCAGLSSTATSWSPSEPRPRGPWLVVPSASSVFWFAIPGPRVEPRGRRAGLLRRPSSEESPRRESPRRGTRQLHVVHDGGLARVVDQQFERVSDAAPGLVGGVTQRSPTRERRYARRPQRRGARHQRAQDSPCLSASVPRDRTTPLRHVAIFQVNLTIATV